MLYASTVVNVNPIILQWPLLDNDRSNLAEIAVLFVGMPSC